MRGRIAAHQIKRPQPAGRRRFQHLVVAHACFRRQLRAPQTLQPLAAGRFHHRRVAGQAGRQQAHVARADAVGLGRQIVDALGAAGQQRKVQQAGPVSLCVAAADHGRAVEQQRALGIEHQPRRLTGRRIPGWPGSQPIGQLGKAGQPAGPILDLLLLEQAAAEAIPQRALLARLVGYVDAGVARVFDLARVQDDQLCAAAAHGPADERGQHRLLLGRIDAGQHDDVGLLHVANGAQPARVSLHGRSAAVIDVIAAHQPAHQFLQQVGRLVAQLGRADGAHRSRTLHVGREGQSLRYQGQRLIPAGLAQLAALVVANHRLGQALRRVHEGVHEAALVADPLVVDGHVLAGHDPAQLVNARVQPHVAALRAVRTDGVGALQLPRPVAEAADAVGQCAHRTEIDNVAAGLGVHRLLREEVDHRLAAAVEQAELRLVLPLFQVTDAAPTDDAALLVQHDQIADRVALLLVGLDLLELGRAGAVLERLVLQWALAAFVADRAVQRVVDEDELQRVLTSLYGGLAGIAELQALGHADGAGRDDHPAAAHVLLHQAHTARAQRVQLGVRAEHRDVDVDQPGRIGQQHPVGDFIFDIVDSDGYEIRHDVIDSSQEGAAF